MSATLQPSAYQSAIYEWVEAQDSRRNLVVEALAGSGKTTTLMEIMKRLPPGTRAIFLAFSKQIEIELSARAKREGIPKSVEIRTLNGCGFRLCLRAYGRGVNMDAEKTRRILRADVLGLDKGVRYHPTDPKYAAWQEFIRYGSGIKRLISLMKGHVITEEEKVQAHIQPFARKYGVDLPEEHEDLKRFRWLLWDTYRRGLEDMALLDFDDQKLYPVWKNLGTSAYDWVLVDESQDLNPLDMALVEKLAGRRGRVIAVGDPNQAIFGFRGADIDAMAKLQKTFDADVLPLPICYRCDKAIIELAKELVPAIKARNGAGDGEECEIIDDELFELVESGDFVLCRTNAPLVQMCLKALGMGRKAYLLGRKGMADGLISFVVGIMGKDCHDETAMQLRAALDAFLQAKIRRYKDTEDEDLLLEIEDKVLAITAISKNYPTVRTTFAAIHDLFKTDTNGGITFSSVHRSKGLEAKRVFILRPDLMPHPMAKSGWAQQQEKNLQYVAITRAMHKLVWVHDTTDNGKEEA